MSRCWARVWLRGMMNPKSHEEYRCKIDSKPDPKVLKSVTVDCESFHLDQFQFDGDGKEVFNGIRFYALKTLSMDSGHSMEVNPHAPR